MTKSILSDLIVFNVKSANKIYAKKNSKTFRKNRDCWGLAIKSNGYTEYECKEKNYISDENHVTVLPKGSSYAWESFGGECLMIDFDANVECDSIISFSVDNSSKIITLFKNVEQNCKKNGIGIKSIRYLYEILTTLLDDNNKEYIPKENANIIMPAVEYITKNFDNPGINSEILSNICGISNVYFRKLFTNLYHVSPMKYVHSLKMKKAAEILKSDYNSIESVAYSAGYNSVYHFSKMFKRYYGVSPSNYK